MEVKKQNIKKLYSFMLKILGSKCIYTFTKKTLRQNTLKYHKEAFLGAERMSTFTSFL